MIEEKYDVYLSSTNQDRDWVSQFVRAIRHTGLNNCLFDAANRPLGESFKQIRDALRESDTLIVILSSNSMESQWTFFELGAAIADQKLIIPILIENVDIQNIHIPLNKLLLLRVSSPSKAGKLVAKMLILIQSYLAKYTLDKQSARLFRKGLYEDICMREIGQKSDMMSTNNLNRTYSQNEDFENPTKIPKFGPSPFKEDLKAYARPEINRNPQNVNYDYYLERIIKTNLDIIILDILKDAPMCGYDIIKKIFESYDIFISQGTVYPLLYSLKEDGIIKAEFDRENMRSKIYSITDKGMSLIKERINEETRSFLWKIMELNSELQDARTFSVSDLKGSYISDR
ncbi:MAG TPA: TIR domain-containing protein [Methanothrix sp.]|nr:TIR domain-containing protein [Methanothrix sp.]